MNQPLIIHPIVSSLHPFCMTCEARSTSNSSFFSSRRFPGPPERVLRIGSSSDCNPPAFKHQKLWMSEDTQTQTHTDLIQPGEPKDLWLKLFRDCQEAQILFPNLVFFKGFTIDHRCFNNMLPFLPSPRIF